MPIKITTTSSGGGVTPGTTVITSGTDKRVLFDDAGKVAESIGLTYDKTVPALYVGDPTTSADRQMVIQQLPATNFSALFPGSVVPGVTTYGLAMSGTSTLINSPTGIERRIANVAIETMDSTGTTAHKFAKTITAGGTTGARTINQLAGTVNFAAAATSVVVTNSLVTTSSIVFAVIRTNDSTAVIKNVVPAAGSFTITLNAAATAETSVGFFVIN